MKETLEHHVLKCNCTGWTSHGHSRSSVHFSFRLSVRIYDQNFCSIRTVIRDLEYADSSRCVSFYDMFLNLVSFFDVTTLIDHERFLHVSRNGLIEFYSSDIGTTGCMFFCEKSVSCIVRVMSLKKKLYSLTVSVLQSVGASRYIQFHGHSLLWNVTKRFLISNANPDIQRLTAFVADLQRHFLEFSLRTTFYVFSKKMKIDLSKSLSNTTNHKVVV